MGTRSNRYESKVHIGLLAIVCLLMILNFVSNYIIFKARSEYYAQAAKQMRAKGLAIGREIRSAMPGMPEDSRIRYLATTHGLSDLFVTPSVTDTGSNLNSTGDLMAAIVNRLPREKLAILAEKLLKSEPNRLLRGEGEEYYYVYPVTAGQYRTLIVMSFKRADLTYLDNAREIMSYLLPSSLVLVLAIYLLLSRKIFSPVRRIIEQAARIGRPVDAGKDEADAAVGEYIAIIDQLRLKEKQLLRLNAEARSRAESLQLFNQHLLASSESGIITFDTEGNLQTINGSARRILRMSTDTDCSESPACQIDSYPELAALIRSAVREKTGVGYCEMTISSPDRSVLDIGLTISIIRDVEDKQVGISMLMNDLTERNRLRRDMEKNSRLIALGEMSGGLAHQLRNSMGAIGGYGRLLKKRAAGSDEIAQMVDSLVGETTEAEDLISRFLSFVRPLELESSQDLLPPLIEEIVRSFEVRQELAHITFKTDLGEIPGISMDRSLLKQAIANILDNAVRSYDDQPGEVRLRLESDHDLVRLAVSDRGCGIPPDNIDRIFTPFFSSRPSGSGLGLPLAARIVDLHGGRISVDSQPGEGTVFTITLPVEFRPPAKCVKTVSTTSA